MPPAEFQSPFPTSHDTLGTSTLGTPMFMPSSPPRMSRIPQVANRKPLQSSPSRVETANAARHRRQQSGPLSPLRNGVERQGGLNHADYTLDMSKLPGDEGGDAEKDLEALPERQEIDELSDIGGPDDFTENMEKYLGSPGPDENNGQKTSDEVGGKVEEQVEGNGDKETEEEGPPGPSAEDAADLEYSEFEPPLDMSTPAHLLSRKHEMSKNGSRLADIEEQPVDSPSSGRRSAAGSDRMPTPVNGRMYADLLKKCEELRSELREKDELLEVSEGKLLQAISAVDQIQHLKSVLQTKNQLLDETNAKLDGESSLRNQIQQLQSELDKKRQSTGQSQEESSEATSLRRQVQQLREELSSKNMLLNEQQEGSAVLLNLRRENDYLREQLSKQDGALEENMAKMNEVTAAKQRQVREKDAEIEDLKARQAEQHLENEKIQAKLESALHDYDTLEEQTEALEDKCEATERQVRDLQAELSITKASRDTQYDALKGLAIHHSVEIGHMGFMELVEDLKTRSLNTASSSVNAKSDETAGNKEEATSRLEKELGDVRLQLQESKSSTDIITLKLEHTQELLSESRTFINTIETENGRLVSRVESLTTDLKNTQDNLANTTQQLDHERAVISDLRNNIQSQQPTLPTPPPSTSTSNNIDHSTIREMHEAEISRLQDSHAAALSSLRDSHAETTLTLHNLLAASQTRETDLKSELNILRNTSSTQASQIETLNAELERLKSVIEDKDAASAAMDARVASSARKREEKWEAKVEVLLKEKERMGKALMWSWGENEVGDCGKVLEETGTKPKKGQGQGYKYKYTKRGQTTGS
ncbi:hypothetical protein FQN54_005324 [Arachnomyces sp. PD_36]|nr:hypothetical protein FQN54_005324 [Arachnomyces sp. PD_36]